MPTVCARSFSPFLAIVLLLELGSLCAQEQEPSLLLWNRGSYNNHLELGLSLDPNTTAVERADPQLSGWVWAVGGRWRWARPTPLGTVGVGLAPSLERYRGSDPLIGNFNGGTLPVELSWRLSAEWGPPFELRLFGVRRSRRASVYNGWESGMELALGRAVRYRVRRLRFDDARSSRRDYLFIGSLRQELSVEADLFVDGPMAAQLRLRQPAGAVTTRSETAS
ncbi:MAG: hypothetical protein KatS3mg115_0817 [Candidatus Poribacteria bacterium]|nr:MAG: hypothetical protein KatS3mg115_0817 [Candidatus Poribacteria bacterium]